MKILACFKIVRDIEPLAPAELSALRDGRLDLSVFKRILGGYDEAALENALRLADAVRAAGGDATVHAATVGECESRFAQDLFAVGVEKIFHLPLTPDTDPGPERVAAALAALVRHEQQEEGYSALFLGRQARPHEYGQTPFLLAAMTGLPCVADTIDLEYRENGIAVTARTDSGTSTRLVVKPVVYVMGEAAHPYLRIATLREKLRSKDKTVERFTPPPHPLRLDAGTFHRHLYDPTEKSCRMLEGATLDETIDVLWEIYQEAHNQ